MFNRTKGELMRSEQITAKALENLNGDRYKLSLVVAKRAQDLSNGAEPLIKVDKQTTKNTDIALLEIAEGKVNLDSLIDVK